jgi:hypothetical protein
MLPVAMDNALVCPRRSEVDFGYRNKIDLSAIDAVNSGSDDAFTFIGSTAFNGHAGQLHYVVNPSGDVTVEGDTKGDGIADFGITVSNVARLKRFPAVTQNAITP